MKYQFALAALAATVFAQDDGLDHGDAGTQSSNQVVKQAGITIDQVAGGPGLPGPIDMQNTYAKYGKPVPAVVVQAAAAATQSGSVTASNLPNDIAYLSPVKIRGQTFKLDFDTGSSDLWVFSNLQPAAQRQGHVSYKLGGTRLDGETWDIAYGDGSGASGVVYGDSVTVGKVSATVQAVEAATSVSSSFVNRQGDGLLGLGFIEGNTCRPRYCNTFMTQVGPTLPQNLFTATLKKGKPGSYDFGFINPNKYTGSIAYSNINHSGSGNPAYWEYIAGGYSIGNGAKVTRNMDVIADTGTSLAYVDAPVAQAYWAKVPGSSFSNAQGGYIFPCTATLPNFSIFSGGAKHTMPGSYANYASLGGGQCYGGIQSNAGIGFGILGDVFLKSQYVVFDIAGNRVGFAQQKGVSI